jgi:conjugal transfer pilus assembly protein TraB
MIEQLKEMIGATFGRGEGDNNQTISGRQKLILKLVIGTIVLIGFGLVILVQEKNKTYTKKNEPIETATTKIELPDTTIDTEKRWREHFENIMAIQKEEINERLKTMESSQDKLVAKASSSIEQELRETKEKLKAAQEELTSASLDLRRVAGEEQERLSATPTHQNAMSAQEFEHEVEFDRPKSAANYIPEGTYFTGYLLGGVVVSTALSTPDENATPVSIRLTGRGNLNKANKTDMAKCSIMGSAYGDLSSERAIIRLEKLVCEHDGLYETSKIAGQIFGPDGYNGIKGTVVSTSSKHIKNAMVGGLISGLSGSAKGQEGGVISGSGLISTKKKGMDDMLTQGALTGTSNAGEKLADYYLRQAEAMSPVLTIPSGVRVNAQITKGFFVGEINTHQKIKQAKK